MRSSALTGNYISKTESQTGNFSYFYTKTWIADYLAKAMVATKSYHGTGLVKKVDGSLYKSDSAFNFEVDGKSYNIADDCSAFGDEATKTAALQAYLTENPVMYYADNVKVITDGMIYSNDTVKVSNNGSVKIFANGSSDCVTVTAGQTAEGISVNDLMDVRLELFPDEGCIGSVKVDGVTQTVTDNICYISKDNAATANNIEVIFIRSLDEKRTETATFDFSSGVKETGLSDGSEISSLTSADGNFKVIRSSGSPRGEYTTVEGVPGLKHEITAGRFGFSTPNFYWNVEREYVYKAKVHNPQSAKIPSYWCARNDGTTGYYFADGSSTSWKSGNPDIGGPEIASGTQYLTLDLGSKISSFSTGENVYGKAYVETVARDAKYAGKYQILLGCEIQETVTVHGILGTENMSGGSVKLNAKSLNFAKKDVKNAQISEDQPLYVEHRMPATLDIVAPEGKVIDKVIWTPYAVDAESVDMAGDSKGAQSATVSLGSITYSGEVCVEYADIASFGIFDHISIAKNKTLYVNGESVNAENVTVIGYGDAVVYKLTDPKAWPVRAYSGDATIDYHNSNLRTMTGWFYDDMSKDCYGYYVSYLKSNAGGIEFSHSGNFGLIKAGDEVYGTNATTGGVNTVPRTKGWHQVITTFDKSGYRIAYIDGICVYKAAIMEGVVPGDKVSRLELRGQGTAYFSDFAVTDYSGVKENYAMTLEATDGSIEGPATVADGETAVYTLKPAEGYEIPAEYTIYDYAGLNTESFQIKDGKISIIPSDDTIIKVAFTEKEKKVPSFAADDFKDTNAFTDKEIGGNKYSATHSLTAYATIDVGYGSTIDEFGIELVKVGKNDSEPLVLKQLR